MRMKVDEGDTLLGINYHIPNKTQINLLRFAFYAECYICHPACIYFSIKSFARLLHAPKTCGLPQCAFRFGRDRIISPSSIIAGIICVTTTITLRVCRRPHTHTLYTTRNGEKGHKPCATTMFGSVRKHVLWLDPGTRYNHL